VQSSLEFVTSVAARLMEATAPSEARVKEQILAELIERLDFDAGFLCYNDHDIRASVLIAEWPPRPEPTESDPLSIVPFSNTDPVFALSAHLKEPVVLRPGLEDSAYLRQVAAGHRVASPLVAIAPLLSGQITIGMLGAVKLRGRKWKNEQINTVKAVASLFAQLQSRIAAEEKLRHLAEHDDPTGIPDRRALSKSTDDEINEAELQDQIDSNSLLLHYLPEVDLWTGAIVAVEALVRLQHPTRGLLLPGSFIRAAESANLAGELGRWVLRSACTRLSQWRSEGVGQNTALRINVSPVQLNGRGFVRSVANTLDEFGVDAGSVCLEITERAVVHDVDSTRRILTELKDVGVQIAIDDFGTGYAVLSHLKSLPVDILKIDKAFVRDLGTNTSDLAIVRAIIGLAEAFGLRVVAEGVETPVAALTLMRHACHRAQGFLLSRPVDANTMESLLSTRWMPMPYLANSEALTAHGI
jgi:EAL domain-containing protein (putative c-di-GMP-specific phosphodiesterase class I)